jgi:signal peptidase I
MHDAMDGEMREREVSRSGMAGGGDGPPPGGRDRSAGGRRLRVGHLRAPLVAVALAVLAHLVALQTYRIASDSMAPTLVAGDQVLVDKLVFGAPLPLVGVRLPALRTPRVGDVLLFRHPDAPHDLYVKRCAGVAGDEVTLSVAEVDVPEGMLFVLGDNRSDSSDSREWGFLPVELVVGRVIRVVWSQGPDGVRWDRIWEGVP